MIEPATLATAHTMFFIQCAAGLHSVVGANSSFLIATVLERVCFGAQHEIQRRAAARAAVEGGALVAVCGGDTPSSNARQVE
jgi:hypothetical protein